MRPHHDKTDGAKLKNKLDQAFDIILNSVHLDTENTSTWAGFMSRFLKNDDRPNIKPNAIIRVMPLFLDKTASTPIVKHMNPGQIPVLVRCFTDTSVHAYG